MTAPTFGGLDIGSRSVKLVLLRHGVVVHEEVRYHTHDPLAVCQELLAGHHPNRLMATGYGRRFGEAQWGCRTRSTVAGRPSRRMH